MDRPSPARSGEALYDVVSCSLVLNFVPSPEGRGQTPRGRRRLVLRLTPFPLRASLAAGRMLEHIRSFLHPAEDNARTAYLFMVLPTPCIGNSRYTSEDHWRGLMRSIGFEQVRERLNKKGKGVAYWLYRRVTPEGPTAPYEKKALLDASGGRNNFAVVL
jgi:25S rRNA (adenine2142-N1)-methyltransferase